MLKSLCCCKAQLAKETESRRHRCR
jgi:hypothetical protein